MNMLQEMITKNEALLGSDDPNEQTESKSF